MTPKLYELTDQYRHLIEDSVDPNTGEIVALDPKDFQTQLDEIRESIGDKAENIGKLWLELQGDSKTVDAEIERLTKTQNRLNQKAQWLKDYLLQELDAAGLQEIKRPTLKISIRTNPPSVNVLDEEAVLLAFKRPIPARWEIDKKKILEYHKEIGDPIEGVEIVEKRRVDIK